MMGLQGCVAVVFCVGILVVEFLIYNGVFLAGVLVERGLWWLIPIFALIVDPLWLMAFLFYWRAHCSDPGRIPDNFQHFVAKTGLPTVNSRHEWQPGKVTYCKKCAMARPERAHHCSVSGYCILRMDHHCPWTANGVGQRNYKFFMMLGIYGCVACTLGLLTMLPWLIYSWTSFYVIEGKSDDHFRDWAFNVTRWPGLLLLLGAIVALAVSCMLGIMVKEHFPNACRGNTTIEENYDNMPNPYDQGSCIDNLTEIFGIPGLDWLLPVLPMRPVTDGVSFAKSGEYLPEEFDPDEIDYYDEDDPPEHVWYWRYSQPNPV